MRKPIYNKKEQYEQKVNKERAQETSVPSASLATSSLTPSFLIPTGPITPSSYGPPALSVIILEATKRLASLRSVLNPAVLSPPTNLMANTLASITAEYIIINRAVRSE
jgi:hypothetical protein